MSGIQMILLGARGAASESYWLAELTGSGVDIVNGVAVGSAGDVYAVGIASGPGAQLSPVQKINTDGVMQWSKSYGNGSSGGAPSGGTNGYAAAVDSSGNLFFGGQILTGQECVVAKYDSSGSVQWQRQLSNSGSNDLIYGVATDSSGNVYAAGNIFSTGRGLIVKYDSSGNLQWQLEAQNTTSGGGTTFYGISVDSSANVYVVGENGGSVSGTPILVIKLDSSGTVQWKRRFYNSDNSRGYAVTTDSSGNVYVCARNEDSSVGRTVMWVLKLNSSGILQWSFSLTSNNAGGDEAKGIGVDSSGNVYISGFARQGSPFYTTFQVIKCESTFATLQWQREITLPTNNVEATCIAISPTGVPYAAGRSSVPFYAKLPANGSGTGSYTINTRTYTYAASASTVGFPTIAQSASPVSINTSSYTDSSVSLSTSPPFTYTFTKAPVV